MPDRDIPAAVLQRVALLGSYALGTAAMCIGIQLVIQADSRISSPGWRVAFAIPGITPDAWGWLLAAAGAVMVLSTTLGSRSDVVLGVASSAVAAPMAGRAVAALIALAHPDASGTAPIVFALLTAIYLAHGLVHFRWFQRLIAGSRRC